jgi:DNA-binding beta-propeller fold protein YncE
VSTSDWYSPKQGSAIHDGLGDHKQTTQEKTMKTKVLKMQSLIALCVVALASCAQPTAAAEPYKVLDTTQVMGSGGIDYVYADNDGRRVYVPRGGQTLVFDLDSHKLIGSITNISGHGVAVDTQSHHGFSSSKPLGMFDTQTLEKIKSIDVQGRPDGILFEPFTQRVYVFSHQAPSITVIDPKDGSIVGTIDVGGAMEQAQSDGQGRLYVDVEDEKKIAVVDVKALKVITKYNLGDQAGEPGGLGLDVKNHILFAMCANPGVCIVLDADKGTILATFPIGKGTDGGGFNPNTMEAFSSQRDGTLTIIKESSPSSFEVEQTVQTKPGCKTSSLDLKNNRIVLICTERAPQVGSATPAAATDAPSGGRRGGGGPGNLDVLWVGR